MQQTVPQPVFLNVEYIFSSFYSYIKGFLAWLFSFRSIAFFEMLATILVILGIALIFYCLVRLYEFKKEERDKEHAEKITATSAVVASSGNPFGAPTGDTGQLNPVWEGVRTKMLSDNTSDWRLAIIEADIYLDKLLDNAGYHGETLSDKLKQVNEVTLPSLQLAWEAHKVRNRIAHDGAAYPLTQPEVRRVLSYYEAVFRDLGAIA